MAQGDFTSKGIIIIVPAPLQSLQFLEAKNMTYVIHPIGHAPFITTNEIPESLSKYHVPGSRITAATGKFGVMLLQEIILEDYSWQYLIFNIEEDTSFHESFDSAVVFSLVTLEGNFVSSFNLTSNFCLTPNQFTIAFLPDYINILHLKKADRYVFVRMVYPRQYVSYAVSFYPAFETFKKNLDWQKAAWLIDQPAYASARILDLIYQLIHSFYSVSVQVLHITILKDILMAMLKHCVDAYKDKNSFSLGYVERIHKAKEFIDMHLPVHFSIGHIAHKVGINEQKLKHGFKEIYGMGLYKYFREQILEIARIQLEETNKPIKEISFDAGYKSQGNFSTAFKKRYGFSPDNWKDHQNRKSE